MRFSQNATYIINNWVFARNGEVYFLKGVLNIIKQAICDPNWSSTAAREASGKEIDSKN